MAPNALPFPAMFVHKNVIGCHAVLQPHRSNNHATTTLFPNLDAMKAIREKFVAVNKGFVRENLLEAVGRFSRPTATAAAAAGEIEQQRRLESARLELMRRALVKRSVREKLDEWQKKKDEMSRARRYDLASTRPRDDVLVKKEDYRRAFEEIQKRVNATTASVHDHRRRAREICFRAVVATAASTASALRDRRPVTAAAADAYRSMAARLDALKNVVAVEEAPLVAAKSLLEDLTLYADNVVTPTPAVQDTRAAKNDNPLNKFSVNVPGDHLVKHVRRQYVALVKNNKLLLANLDGVKNVPFAVDPMTKTFRRNVVRVVNTLINTVSSSSAAHMSDKYDRLDALLSGRPVRAANALVMAGRNREAVAFCMDTLSVKIVGYAEQVLCVNGRAAYEIAALATRLWCAHQRFGKVLFAEIKRRCPLLVPFCYPAARSLTYGQMDHEAFGYRADAAGVFECDAKYLKRVTGIVRLYAALMVTSARSERPVVGLSHAWTFVAGTLNQNPVADVTATMLVEFLNVAGCAMQQAYGRQFVKLMEYVDTRYMKKIVAVTPAGHGGPVTRLQGFVSKCLRDGQVEEPEGILPSDFL